MTSWCLSQSVIFLSFCSFLVTANQDLTRIPSEYSNCLCHWSDWMNSDDPIDDDKDDETYRHLRSQGYQFCDKPVALHCFNNDLNRLVDPSNNAVTCDVDLGLRCDFFCDDYKVKVACCYCPPDAIGPTFQIISEHNEGCLTVNNNTGSSPFTEIEASCDSTNARQQWSWVSQSQIKSSLNEQCIAVEDSKVVTADCDVTDKTQWWSYDKIQKSLSSGFGYLDSYKGDYVPQASKSRWMAKVEIGKTDLTTMQGFPCPAEPNPPQNGSVACSFGSYQGSVCQFACDRGFKLPSSSPYPVTCMINRQYNGTTPACQRTTCLPSPPSTGNGQAICSDGAFVDSVCRFDCEEGYRLSGSRTLTCSESGQWNSAAPKCLRIECQPNLEEASIDHGFVNCSNANYLNSRCGYSCEAGYDLEGPVTRVCSRDSEWSATKPSCSKLQCPELSSPANGTKSCGEANYYGSTCTFSCKEGYTLVGRGSVSCNSEGAWGGDPPNCERKTCSSLDASENGRLSCLDGNYFGSVCSFSCDEGYSMEGESSLKCTADGWNHGSPKCKRIQCSHLLAPINGNVACSDKEFYGSHCAFTCDRYYDVVGSQVMVCGDNGWNATHAPTCRKRTCPPYANPRHGRTQCFPGGYEVDSVCLINCNEGYVLSPPNFDPATCLENGTWKQTQQSCRRIKCRSVTYLRDGKVRCSDRNNFQSKCEFSCSKGYNLYGSNETVCGANGWSEQTPTCDKVYCFPQFSQLRDGNVQCKGEGEFTCTFSCKVGYNLIGNSTTECQPNGSWTNPNPPTCERVSCNGGTTAPSHGKVKCTEQNLYGSVCNFTCVHGYDLDGQNLIECLETGDWNGQHPTCQRISCTAQQAPSNGVVNCVDANHYGSECDFSCDRGFQLIGARSIRCLINKTWNDRTPYCEGISCSPGFSNPSNGHVQCSNHNNLDSTCTFSCNEGFKLTGSQTTQCGGDGQWSRPVAPTCTKITCPMKDPLFADGSESCNGSNELNSVCKYTCNEGYQLYGTSSRTCLNTGKWSDDRPECLKIQCPVLSIGKNGNMECTHQFEFESECVFTCAAGYRRVGPEKVVCTRKKFWNPAELPACELISIVIPTPMTTTPPPTTTTSPASQTSGFQPSKPNYNPPNSVVEGNKTQAESLPTSPGQPVTTTKSPPQAGPTEAEDGFPIIIVALSIGIVALLVIIVLAVFFFRKRRIKKRPSFKGISLRDRYDDSHLQKLLSSNGSSGRRFPPILVDRLESEFSRKHADDDKLFREEFANIPEGQGSREQGGKAVNKEKNRYTNVIPYDHSRVVLPRATNSDPDYINASFIDGYKHKGKFIAAQGPKENTTIDFWRMIWDQNVTTVIMVTNLVEGKETKCAQYWPQHGSQLYGDLNVCFTGENRLVDYTVRKFTIQQVSGESTLSMRRNLVQYHFTSWPDFGVPKSPSGMLKFLRKIKHGSPTGYGAIVVHCSAGVGRTGTFICLDAMLDMMAREGKIDVYGFVTQMRGQRPEMVQTEQQYIFIYQAILEQHLYGDTEIEAADITLHIDELNKRLPGNVTGMEHEFKKLTTIRIQKEQMRAGNHPGNMRKNRVLLILPYDWNRVILPNKRGEENSDYINASYIDGYRQKDAYIATQGPLAHTVEDFWRLIWQTQSASIVMLTELVERGQTKCEQYWPDSDVMIYGDISVENIGGVQMDNYTTRDFVLTSTSEQNDRKQIVRQFHYHAWPESGPPVSGYSMIALVEQVQKQQQTSGNHPITIHCSAGAGRTGAFCALSTALEQVKAEGVLDMFQIVKCLRMQRPHMVQNLEQYEFCYRAVQEYLDSMSEYYNFK